MAGRWELSADDSWAMLERAEIVDMAGPGPMLRSLHPSVLDRQLWFHGGRTGDKSRLVGAQVVVQAREVVARVPSWMRDPERACPATTWFRSVQATGHLEEVHEPELKARALQALMDARQPEGRCVPIAADEPLYRKSLRTTRVLRLDPTRVVGVSKLGQHLSAGAMTTVLRGLWHRGAPGDLRAIEVVSRSHAARPTFAEVPQGLRPRCHPDARDAQAAAALVADAYWNPGFTVDQLAEAVLHSDAWVGLEEAGVLVATARGISDRSKRGWVYDVAVHPDVRGRGFGASLMRLLLSHPALRGTHLMLGTRDAMGFYRRHGFEDEVVHDQGPHTTTVMRRRPRAQRAGTSTR